MVGSALPATSGTPRPVEGALPVPEVGFFLFLLAEAAGAGTLALACQVGSGKTVEIPPPVAPSLAESSFQTTSPESVLPEAVIFVPPQARTCGLEAGKSTWLLPSVTPSVEPLSPAATVMVTPSRAAAWQALSSAVVACAVQGRFGTAPGDGDDAGLVGRVVNGGW